ncbi:MAG: hypothetical protein V3V01_02795 [Acidimicrobiales bacterium]
MTETQLLTVAEPEIDRQLFDERALAALDYADAITRSTAIDDLVTDELFRRVVEQFSTKEIVVLTELIAWENASARFNRALGVASQGLWQRSKSE